MRYSTKSEAINGSDNTSIMTPLRVKQSIEANSKPSSEGEGGGGVIYTAGTGINISSDNVISNTITNISQLNNDSNFIESDDLKTINGQSIIGQGDIVIEAGSTTQGDCNVVVSPTTPTTDEPVWVQYSYNMFDKSTTTFGHFLEDGTSENHSAYGKSDYIPVEPNETYTLQHSNEKASESFNILYDKNKKFVASIVRKPGNNVITIPDGVYYIRVTLSRGTIGSGTADDEDNTFQMVKGSKALPYMAYNPAKDDRILLKKGDEYDELFAKSKLNYPIASYDRLGMIKVGANLWIDDDGTLNAPLYEGGGGSGGSGTGSTNWVNAELTEDFTLYNDASYCRFAKVGNIVHIQGVLKPTKSNNKLNSATETTAFNLPEEYRPSQNLNVLCQGSGTNIFNVGVNVSGNVNIYRYRNSASYASSPPGTSTWLPFNVTYFIDTGQITSVGGAGEANEVLRIGMTAKATITLTAAWQKHFVPFTEEVVKLGTNLSITSDGRIKIGAGIDKIAIYGTVLVASTVISTLDSRIRVFRNGAQIDATGFYTHLDKANDYRSSVLINPIVDVQEGDIVDLIVTSDKVGTLSIAKEAFLCVAKVCNSNVLPGSGGSDYTLPIATPNTLGGIKVGETLDIDEEGNLNTKFDPILDEEKEYWNSKQDELKSGVNIKTINNQSILGPGNIDTTYKAGDGISIEDNIITNTITSYEQLTDKPFIPTKLSDLIMDTDPENPSDKYAVTYADNNFTASQTINGSLKATENVSAGKQLSISELGFYKEDDGSYTLGKIG